MQSLHQRATLDGNRIEPPPAPLPDPDVVFDHIMGLASLARALKPDLPQQIRFVRYAPLDEAERNTASFKVMFTEDTRPLSQDGYRDPNARELWEVLEEVLPADMVQAERDNLSASPRFRFAAAADAAVYSAFRRERLSIETKVLDEDRVIQASDAVRPAEMAFLSTPTLARWVYLAPVVGNEEALPPNISAFRRDVHLARRVLAQDFQQCSGADRQSLVDALGRLSSRRAGNFETEQGHGWIGYSLAQGAKGWTKFLLANGASPFAPYQAVAPTAWAVASDDVVSLRALCSAGATPSAMLSSAPMVYKGNEQRELAARMGSFPHLITLAAACGATRALAGLLDEGANIDAVNATGATAAHVLAAAGDERSMRVLIGRHARLDIEDRDGNLAAQYVPEGQDALFDLMETMRLGEARPATLAEYRQQRATDAYGQEPSLWDDVAAPPRPRTP